MASSAATRTDSVSTKAKRALRMFEHGSVRIVDAAGTEVVVSEAELPGFLYHLSKGSVAELTTQQAADMLNVSRPYLIRMLDKGELPFRRVGNRRKVPMAAVVEFRRKRSRERLALLSQMATEAYARGEYFEQ